MRRLFEERLGPEVFPAYLGARETFVCRVLPDLLAHGTDRLDTDALRAALDDALDETDGRTWGEMHTLALAHPLARIPGLDTHLHCVLRSRSAATIRRWPRADSTHCSATARP